jgi:hypothetical protein
MSDEGYARGSNGGSVMKTKRSAPAARAIGR